MNYFTKLQNNIRKRKVSFSKFTLLKIHLENLQNQTVQYFDKYILMLYLINDVFEFFHDMDSTTQSQIIIKRSIIKYTRSNFRPYAART
jgi:hypothetical protein